MTAPRVLTRSFWTDLIDPTVRSAAQGFIVGAGVTSGAGDVAVLSGSSITGGLVAAGSMVVLSVVFALAAGPTNQGA